MGRELNHISYHWEHPAIKAVCEQCGWVFIILNGIENPICPHCFSIRLEIETGPISQKDQIVEIQPPELVLPFKISLEQINSRIKSYTQGIPFASPDIKLAPMDDRIVQLYLPYWLLDCDITADWEIEAGYEYEPLSHRERYNQKQKSWQTEKVIEQRVRWEPRVGRLNRSYCNTQVPALEDQKNISKLLGPYDLASAGEYQARRVQNALIRLPDLHPDEAWGEARLILQTFAAEECRAASAADQQRNFRWKPTFSSQSWTLLLQPVYATYYRDDDDKPVPIFINGQSGQVTGIRRSSLKRGKRASSWILGAAILLFLISSISGAVVFLAPPVLLISIICFIASALVALAALAPVAIVWQYNHTQRRGESALP